MSVGVKVGDVGDRKRAGKGGGRNEGDFQVEGHFTIMGPRGRFEGDEHAGAGAEGQRGLASRYLGT